MRSNEGLGQKSCRTRVPEFFEFSARIVSRIFLRIFEDFRALLPRKRRPQKSRQTSPPFFNAKSPGKYEQNIHNLSAPHRCDAKRFFFFTSDAKTPLAALNSQEKCHKRSRENSVMLAFDAQNWHVFQYRVRRNVTCTKLWVFRPKIPARKGFCVQSWLPISR